MKKALTSAGVNTARFYQVNNTDELHRAIRELNFPVIVKATDLQGSKGIYIANNMDEAEFGFAEAMSMTRQKYCIVEEFIVGTEFGAEAFVYHGEVLFVLPNGKNTQMGYTAVPVGHYAPMDWSEEVLEKARIVTEKAIKAVGLDNCAVNIDLIERDGEVYVIELTGRMGANCLPELVSIYYQVPYYKMAVMMALGLDPREEFNKRSERGVPNASAMLTSDRDGILSSISCDISDIPGVYELSYFLKKGLRVHRFTNSRDCVGQAIVQGESIEDCFEKLDRIRKNLILELDPLPCD
jgi:biotin carboxylase